MAWVKLDDNFHWHRKVAPLSDGAYRLYVGALCYCNRFSRGDELTMPEILGLVGNARKANRLINELERANLWALNDGGWTIHDYFSYQPDPQKQAAGRARAQQALSTRSAPSRTRPVPVPLGVNNPSVGSPDDDCSIESRGWTGGEESTGEVLGRFKPRQSGPHKEAI